MCNATVPRTTYCTPPGPLETGQGIDFPRVTKNWSIPSIHATMHVPVRGVCILAKPFKMTTRLSQTHKPSWMAHASDDFSGHRMGVCSSLFASSGIGLRCGAKYFDNYLVFSIFFFFFFDCIDVRTVFLDKSLRMRPLVCEFQPAYYYLGRAQLGSHSFQCGRGVRWVSRCCT